VNSAYADLPDYEAIVRFRDEFEPAGEANYEWVETYGKERYRELVRDFEFLDARAGFIITFLGGGFGVLTVGSLAMPAALPWWVVLSLSLPIGAAIWAIYLAIESRRTIEQPAGPTVEKAAEYVAFFGSQSRNVFLGHWHFLNEIQRRINDRKATETGRAGRWAFYSIALLSFPFIFGVIWRASESNNSPTPPKITEVLSRSN
jgi:hypothetical protein